MRAGKRPAAGYTYVMLLAALAIFGIGLAALGESWSSVARRDREQELLLVGEAYAHAIEQYYLRSPGVAHRYPARLEDLVEDRRFVGVVRHLRQLYADPVTRGPFAVERAPDGGIMGVYSPSAAEPLRRTAYRLKSGILVYGSRYMDWKFDYVVSGRQP